MCCVVSEEEDNGEEDEEAELMKELERIKEEKAAALAKKVSLTSATWIAYIRYIHTLLGEGAARGGRPDEPGGGPEEQPTGLRGADRRLAQCEGAYRMHLCSGVCMYACLPMPFKYIYMPPYILN